MPRDRTVLNLGGRSEILIIPGIRFFRWPAFLQGCRSARPVRKHAARSRFSAPRD